MRLRRHVSLLESTIKHATTRQLLSPLCNRCRYASSSAAYPENIAVLGGGISGLASAYFVAKEFPNSKITIFESQKETGGWIRSRRVDVPGGNALFEYGPRTLRPGAAALPTAQLIQELDLVKDVIYTDRTAPSATNRFIFYPDRLNCLPSAVPSPFQIFELWRSGLLDGASSALFEPWRKPLSRGISDESVGDFITRRLDKRLANNVVSAVIHGIYAGDIWNLSARTLLAHAWKLEQTYGSVLQGMGTINQETSERKMVGLWHPYDLDSLSAMREEITLDGKFAEQLKKSSVFTFRNGLQALVKALQENLEQNPQVEIKIGTPVDDWSMAKGTRQRVTVKEQNNPETTHTFDLLISTLRSHIADDVTVMTVNLFFSNPSLLPVQGFGYLIPQSVPFEQNPERALGVIFDSDVVSGQDTANGTKLTVMLGGHWWNGWEEYPSSEEGLELAKSILARHLGITEEPAAYHVNLSKDCIPQYTVGYEDRVQNYAEGIKNSFRGRMRVVGNEYNGVGVNDCIRGAWLMARGLRDRGWKERKTGLERATDERNWVVAPMKQSWTKTEVEGVV